MDLKNLNESFEKMFEDIMQNETFVESFDEEYAAFATEIDEDNALMCKMYKVGNVSPAAALESLGYVETAFDTMEATTTQNGVEYKKVFKFYDDFTHEYFVLQDGKVPSGWTTTKSAVDDEEIEECISRLEEALGRLNEAEMSDEDKRDSDLIRSMLDKMQARSNAAFTPEEKAVMTKYGIVRDNNTKSLSVDGRDLNRDVDTMNKDRYFYNTKGHNNGNEKKINYADRARKLPQRKDSQIFTGPWTVDNDQINTHGYNKTKLKDLQDAERYAQDIPMRDKMTAMKNALRDRKYYQSKIDNADDERAKKMAKAQAAFDKAKADADQWYKWDTEDASKSRDYHQKTIDNLLKKEKNEAYQDTNMIMGQDSEDIYTDEDLQAYWDNNCMSDPVLAQYTSFEEWKADTISNMTELEEDFSITPNKDAAYDIIRELSEEGLVKIAESFVRWMSDSDVGEFLHQNGYVEYED